MKLSQLAQIQKLKTQLDAFQRNHPKFTPFLDAVNKNALAEGTIIEIKVTSPEGKHYETPRSSAAADRINAIGMMTMNPLRMEMICAGSAFSVDVK